MKRIKFYDKNGFYDWVTIPDEKEKINQLADSLIKEAKRVDIGGPGWSRPTPDMDARNKIANRLRDKAKFVRSFV